MNKTMKAAQANDPLQLYYITPENIAASQDDLFFLKLNPSERASSPQHFPSTP